MPVEIKELIIKALVGGSQDQKSSDEDHEQEEQEAIASNSQDAIAAISNMLKQEKER